MRVRGSSMWGLALLLAAVPAAQATSIVPPANLAEAVALSDAACVAAAGLSASHARGVLIFTDTEFVVEEVVAGALEPGERIVVRTPGGEVGGRAWHVAGSPRFSQGGAYLLCLRREPEGVWTPRLLGYGLLEETLSPEGKALLVPCDAAGEVESLPRPDGTVPERMVPYRKDALLRALRDVLAGRQIWDAAAVETGETRTGDKAPPAACTYFTSGGRRLRWSTFDSGGSAAIYASTGGDASVAGGGFREVVQALDLWHGIAGTSLNLEYGGVVDASLTCTADEDIKTGMIIFNDPCSDMEDLRQCTGILAYGGPFASGATHRFDGEYWVTIQGWAVVVNNGSGCIGSANFARMLAHELGHGLGFGHFNDAGALMYQYCCNAPNSTDVLCAAYTYPPGVAGNQRPAVDAGEDMQLVLAGDTAVLTGTASDDGLPATPGALTYQWRQLGGPGTVTFEDARVPSARVHFPLTGSYLFALRVTDGELSRTDAVALEVEINTIGTRTLSFQDRSNGYQGTRDTYVRQDAPGTGNETAAVLRVDGDTGAKAQALIAFDGVFGADLAQVPPGARIVSARLEVTGAETGDTVALHRMLTAWEEGAVWSDFGADGIVPGGECTATAEAAAAATANVTGFNVTASLAAWSQDPCAVFGWALLETGTDGWTFSSREGVAPPCLVVTYAIAAPVTLIAKGDAWRYFKGTADPPSAWATPSFAPDASWFSGATGIGYGDNDDATVLGDMQGAYLTLYCRRDFTPGLAGALRLSIDYDDGFVAYMNGEEVARSASMGAAGDPVTRTTAADSHEAGSAETFVLDTAPLRAGTNVLAIEVHNERLSSSDVSFVPELVAENAVIAPGATWSFLRGSAPLPATWDQPEFDDGAWERGPTGIGYGDGDDATVLADMAGAYLAVFCRTRFQIADPAVVEELNLSVLYDDGIAAFLNGVELGRANLPAGTITADTKASASVETQKAFFRISPSLLRPGANVLAVSVHNASLTSGDLSFVPALYAVAAARAVTCGPAPELRRGDANADGTLDIADAVRTLGYLFQRGEAPGCPDAFDANDDGRIDISDPVGLLRHLFAGQALPDPGAVCGPDPTVDDLGECAATPCAR